MRSRVHARQGNGRSALRSHETREVKLLPTILINTKRKSLMNSNYQINRITYANVNGTHKVLLGIDNKVVHTFDCSSHEAKMMLAFTFSNQHPKARITETTKINNKVTKVVIRNELIEQPEEFQPQEESQSMHSDEYNTRENTFEDIVEDSVADTFVVA